MPVIYDLPVKIEEKDIFRRQQIRDASRVNSKVSEELHELILLAHKLITPVMVYEIYLVTGVTSQNIILHNGVKLSGINMASTLSSAQEIAVAVCTIGINLERKVDEFIQNKKTLKGILLDGIGSAAIDLVANEGYCFIKQQVKESLLETSSPLGPGMHGWDIEEQRILLSLLPVEQIGISITTAAMMVPRKSISMAIGIGHNMPTWSRAESCELCKNNTTCNHRVL